MLPFDVYDLIEPQGEPLRLGKIEIPCYGSLTPQEYEAFQQIPVVTNQDVTVILLKRVFKDFSREELLELVAQLPSQYQIKAAEFFINESRQWQEVATSAGKKQQKVKWQEIFWMLQIHYPSDPRFTKENFGNTPIWIIEQAVAAVRVNRTSNAYLASLAPAVTSYVVAAANGAKRANPDDFNPVAKILKQDCAQKEIPAQAATVFLELARENRIPGWVAQQVDVESIRMAAEAG